jgi:hypothetical protein
VILRFFLGALLVFAMSAGTLAETPWYDRVINLQKAEGEIVDFSPDGSNDYTVEIAYPFWLANSAVVKLLKTKGLNAALARFGYAVYVTQWLEWIKDPKAEQPDWLLGARSRTHVILVRDGERTRVHIREEIQKKTTVSKAWIPQGPAGIKGDAQIKAVLAGTVLLMRFSSESDITKDLIAQFQSDPDFGTDENYKLSPAHPLPVPNERDIDRTLRSEDPDQEIGYLKRLYWTGRINDREYEFLEPLIPDSKS